MAYWVSWFQSWQLPGITFRHVQTADFVYIPLNMHVFIREEGLIITKAPLVNYNTFLFLTFCDYSF